MPLHIFEPRYRQMIEDLLDTTGRLVIGTVQPGHEDDMSGSPPVHSIAGLGEIVRHDRRDDGCYDILVYGLSRVRIDEVNSDRSYRKVEIEKIPETPAEMTLERELRPKLLDAVRSRIRLKVDMPEDMPLGQLTDLLLLSLRLPEDRMMVLYAMADVADRAIGALQEHSTHPIEEREVISDTLEIPQIEFDGPSFDAKDADQEYPEEPE